MKVQARELVPSPAASATLQVEELRRADIGHMAKTYAVQEKWACPTSWWEGLVVVQLQVVPDAAAALAVLTNPTHTASESPFARVHIGCTPYADTPTLHFITF